MDSSDAATHVNWQSGSWTNVMPPTYGYEVIQPPSLSQPAETFLAPAAAAAQHEIRLLESQPHVVAVRPHRGGEMTNRSSRERRNMIQVHYVLSDNSVIDIMVEYPYQQTKDITATLPY